MKYKHIYIAIGSMLLTVSPAFSQSSWVENWGGEAAASISYKTGNTESTDAGIGIKLKKEGEYWGHLINFTYDYGKSHNIKTKDRLFAGYQIKRKFTQRFYTYGDASYEKDAFQGYNYRTFLGVGAGYTLIDDGQTFWSLDAGPGWRKDSLTGGKTANYFAIKGSSHYRYIFNESVNFTNDTSVIWTKENTQLVNDANINAKLVGSLSARFGLLTEYNTKPPIINSMRKKKTDTTTRATLVYSF